MSSVEITPASIRFAAMNLLAMREHSLKELKQKLALKFDDSENIINEVLNNLVSQGLQSDKRFADAFTIMRKRQGKGPVIVTMELCERGITRDLIQEFVDPESDEWSRLALSVRQKKYGDTPASTLKEKAKQMRFLSGRGFNAKNIKFALREEYADDY